MSRMRRAGGGRTTSLGGTLPVVLRQKVVRSETECIVVRDGARAVVKDTAGDCDGRRRALPGRGGLSVHVCGTALILLHKPSQPLRSFNGPQISDPRSRPTRQRGSAHNPRLSCSWPEQLRRIFLAFLPSFHPRKTLAFISASRSMLSLGMRRLVLKLAVAKDRRKWNQYWRPHAYLLYHRLLISCRIYRLPAFDAMLE